MLVPKRRNRRRSPEPAAALFVIPAGCAGQDAPRDDFDGHGVGNSENFVSSSRPRIRVISMCTGGLGHPIGEVNYLRGFRTWTPGSRVRRSAANSSDAFVGQWASRVPTAA
jgi:hypothetical protein